jgi:arginyl-tRNA--protein-N-Asp/Glu arginylyltransferase
MSYKTRFQPLELLIDGTWQAANAKGDIIARS